MNCLNCGEEMKAENTCKCSPTFCSSCCQCGASCELCNCGAAKAKAESGEFEEGSDEEAESEG